MGCSLMTIGGHGMLRMGRESRGIGLHALAQQLRISKDALFEIEAARQPPPQHLLKALSRILHYPEHFFLQEPSEEIGHGYICGPATKGDTKTLAICACGRPADYLCDFPMGGGKTCDIALCASCRIVQAQNIDYCRQHSLIARGMVQSR